VTGWNARRHATAASLLVLCAVPFPVLSGQAVSVLPGAAVALVSQDGPLGGQSGVGGGLGLTDRHAMAVGAGQRRPDRSSEGEALSGGPAEVARQGRPR